jgi:hypothetical protein
MDGRTAARRPGQPQIRQAARSKRIAVMAEAGCADSTRTGVASEFADGSAMRRFADLDDIRDLAEGIRKQET